MSKLVSTDSKPRGQEEVSVHLPVIFGDIAKYGAPRIAIWESAETSYVYYIDPTLELNHFQDDLLFNLVLAISNQVDDMLPNEEDE